MVLQLSDKSDLIGSVASGLCVVHCIATPFLFVAQSCTISDCCASGPAWWSSIDYIFIVITFFAVFQSAKHTSNVWLKYGMYACWILLTALILNEKFGFWGISENWKYLSSVVLIGLHLYNLKYCKCDEASCCTI